MKLVIRAGDVPIRWAKCMEHSRGVFTLQFHTPLTEAVACEFRQGWSHPGRQSLLIVDVYAARCSEPSQIILELGQQAVKEASGQAWLGGQLLHYSDKRHLQTVIALPDGILDHRYGVQAEAEANFRVDYLESNF